MRARLAEKGLRYVDNLEGWEE
ncbi:hypothetical protein BN437_2006 [Erwinia amylovora NBRC 12687 = CFBP 1232]|nr:hypothetical protein BN437_2006 [Erwinia amylovora NBRC 12687 = CFBP 1232]